MTNANPLSLPFSSSLSQCKTLELKLEEERVFTEYEQVLKKRADCVLTTATLPENTERNRFRDVVPYEQNRVELVPNKENNTGYINASHIKVCSWGQVIKYQKGYKWIMGMIIAPTFLWSGLLYNWFVTFFVFDVFF